MNNPPSQTKTFQIGIESAAKNVAWMREVNNVFYDLVNSIIGQDNRTKEGRPVDPCKTDPCLLNSVFSLNDDLADQIRFFEENVSRLRNSLN